MSTWLRAKAPKAAAQPQGAGEDGTRKWKRKPFSVQLGAERDLLFKKRENGAAKRQLVQDYNTLCAKFLLEGQNDVYFNAYKCTRGTFHTKANTWAVLDEARYGLCSEECAPIYVQCANLMEDKNTTKAAFYRLKLRGGGGRRGDGKPKRGGRGGSRRGGLRGSDFRRGQVGSSRN